MAIENLSAIEKTLMLPEGTLSKAIESTENVNIDLQDLEVFTKSDYSLRIENLKSTFQKQGADFFVKDAKEKLGLEFEGKTLDAFHDAIIKKANISPDTKVLELQKDLEKVRLNLAEKDNVILSIEKEYKAKESKRVINETILSKINIETSIPKEDVLTIFKSKYEVNLENDNLVFSQKGEVLKNQKTLNPLGIDEVFASFLPTYAKEVTGGKADNDNFGKAKSGSMDAFIEEMTKKSVQISSAEFNTEMSKRITNKTLSF